MVVFSLLEALNSLSGRVAILPSKETKIAVPWRDESS